MLWSSSMDLDIFTPNELPAVLGALRHVALANDDFTDGERALIEGVARIHGFDISADDLPRASFGDVADIVVVPKKRTRVAQLGTVTALVEESPSYVTEDMVRELAFALDIGEAGVDVLYEVPRGGAFVARLDMLRRVGRFIRRSKSFP